MSQDSEQGGKPHWLKLPFRRMALCILIVYVSVASNYLSLGKQEASFLVTHPTAQLALIYVLALVVVREHGQRWLSSFLAAGLVTAAFMLLAHVL